MNRDADRQKSFTRRAFLLGGGGALLFSGLAARLAWLQLLEEDRFKMLSDQNRIGLRLLAAGRGDIVDRFGVPLASNSQNFRAMLVAEQTPDVQGILERLALYIPLSEREKTGIMAAVKKSRPFTPILVKENLTWEEMAKIEVRLPELPGISVDEGKIRSYPLGKASAHLIGYVGLVSEAEMTDDPIMSLPGFRIGKSGIEKKLDMDLRGEAGRVQAEVNAVGREIRELVRTPAKEGKRVVLTIDADLQMRCYERLMKERSASAVVMNVKNGDIYALGSASSFDPNEFTRGISAELWEELQADDTHPLINKVTAGQYPPGSTFKMVTALAALDAGVIGPGHSVFCPGYMELGNARFHCWKAGGHGTVGMTAALAQSCDTFFYDVAKRVGVDRIATVARKLGLGAKLGLELPGELPGLVPDQKWKMQKYGVKWQAGETLNAGIGQGYMLTTPVQLAVMTARLVNGGNAVVPRLVRSTDGVLTKIKEAPGLGFKKAHLDLVRRGMEAVMEEKGTAYGARITQDGYSMAGKTGTAQVKRISMAERLKGIKNETLEWKLRHHALFVAYGPIGNPKYAAAVVVEHGVSGAGAAAPVARDLMLAVQQSDPASRRSVDEKTEAVPEETRKEG